MSGKKLNYKLRKMVNMGSSNNTMHKFGIEYGYIALAMGNMLKDTNKNIKNIEINHTESIIIDYNWNCILSMIGTILVLAGITIGLVIFGAATGGTSVLLGLGILASLGIGLGSLALSVYHDGNNCFGGW